VSKSIGINKFWRYNLTAFTVHVGLAIWICIDKKYSYMYMNVYYTSYTHQYIYKICLIQALCDISEFDCLHVLTCVLVNFLKLIC